MQSSAERKVIQLIIVSDWLCPWCYVGHRELENAIARCADLPLDIQVEYRPYRLNLALSEDLAVSRSSIMKAKFGEDKAEGIKKMLEARGAALGINFSFNGKVRQTTRAHRLAYKAHQMGGQALQMKLVNILFKTFYEEDGDLGDVDLLADRAEKAGVMCKEKAVDFLESDECLAEVEAQMDMARQKGITGVPFTVINHKYAVSGGQTSECFVQIFNKLAQCFECQAPAPTVSEKPTVNVAPQALVA